MPHGKLCRGPVITALVALALLLVSACCLRVSPYKVHAGILPAKESMLYAGSFVSIIFSDDDWVCTEKNGYALQLGRLQFTLLKTTAVSDLRKELQ